ncbi:ATP-NAD kinase family protein [Alkaliphilus peptidifermentans]|uniref:Predicted polyphosphate-or ATP-dependent NAD kinase n=1 Tax=Alkaliphilus peptidifermentans DSM 18978 TaxID=1120976 RepID=A0A1G5BJ61_9FIRM|nr:ATP-NAD kinase family protein [Alkaliphilus peptidifermentans]SCX90137.1 Predicted polyphosphate-or ATP-dependent NAD kinase [Alkaliphilus peptidifermentans DSM 18978]
MTKKIGLIVNPVAGIGGRAGLKGSDSPEIIELAAKMGIESESRKRSEVVLTEIYKFRDKFELIVAPGEMGEDAAKAMGFNPMILGEINSGSTTSNDTEKIAMKMMDMGVDLLLFVGGDGTARNIYNAVNTSITVLGIPSGVKMHSSVFSITPKIAGELISKYFQNGMGTREAEVMDIDEELFRHGKVVARLYGYLKVPNLANLVQGTKVGGIDTEASIMQGIATTVTEMMKRDNEYIYIIGPGTTTRAITDKLDLESTLLGVDVLYKNKLVAKDVDEITILNLIRDKPAKIIVTPIGGQGYVFGRGNQQISYDVIKLVGKNNIIIVSTIEKLTSIKNKTLLVDTGREDVDNMLCGVYRIITGYRSEHTYKIK